MPKTLDLLPPLPTKGKSFGTAVREAAKRGAQPAKPQFNVPKMKQVVKLAEQMGKQVTNLTVNGDGGFTVAVANSNPPSLSEPNEWD